MKMHISGAKRILEAAISLDEGLGKLDDAVSRIDDVIERNLWIERLGRLIFAINYEIIENIYEEYPKLRE
jgi:hypothetical protein